jgi:quinol monooxygenase YgiN
LEDGATGRDTQPSGRWAVVDQAERKERQMYGTVASMKAKPGSGELLAELGRQINDDRPAGMVGLWVYRLDADPDEYMMAVAFDSREAYRANADSPEQDARYQQLRELLDADPTWHDGEIVYSDGPLAS